MYRGVSTGGGGGALYTGQKDLFGVSKVKIGIEKFS